MENRYIPTSFDPNTITFNNDWTVEKITSCEEIKNLEEISFILDSTNLNVVEIISKEETENWKCKILTKFIEWRNLEDLLINDKENYKKYVELLKKLVEDLEKAWIIINDLAPRNIFVNDWEITLLDFEKWYIKLENLTEDKKKFCYSFYIREDFSAFLENEDVKYIFWDFSQIDFWNIRDDILGEVSLWSRRERFLKIFLEKTNWDMQKVKMLMYLLNNTMSDFISNPENLKKLSSISSSEYDKEILELIKLKI